MGVREEQLGKRVRALRAARGWNQAQLLEAARRFLPSGEVFDRTTVSRIEHGHQWPRSGTLNALAGALGVSAGYLVGQEEPAGPPGSGPGVPLPEPEFAAALARLNALPGPVRARVALVVDDLLDVLDEAGAVQPASAPESEPVEDSGAEELDFELDEFERELDALLLRFGLDESARAELLSMVGKTLNSRFRR